MLRLCLRSRVWRFLNELSDSLDETYERILKEIHRTNRGYAQRLLQCLAMAIRPLRVDELAEVLTFDPDAIEEVPTLVVRRPEDQEREFLSACPSLITIVDSDDSRVVQFSHFPVKEFLVSDRLASSSEDILRYRILPDAAHNPYPCISWTSTSFGRSHRQPRCQEYSSGRISCRTLNFSRTGRGRIVARCGYNGDAL